MAHFVALFLLAAASLQAHGAAAGCTECAELMEWAKKSDIHVHSSLTLQHADGMGLGYWATQPIEAGEVLLSVPARMLFLPSSGHPVVAALQAGDDAFTAAADEEEDEPGLSAVARLLVRHADAVNALFLEYELALQADSPHLSKWGPWLSRLRGEDSAAGTPAGSGRMTQLPWQLPLNESDLKALFPNRAAFLEEQAAWAAATLAAAGEKGEDGEHEHVQRMLGALEQRRFNEAASTMLARSLHVRSAALDSSAVVVPMGDLFNHSPDVCGDSPHYGFDLASQSVQLLAAVPSAEGDAVRICYGQLSNEQLLQRFGFTVMDNPHDRVTLKLQPLEDDPTARQRVVMLEQLALPQFESLTAREVFSPRFLRSVQVVIMMNSSALHSMAHQLQQGQPGEQVAASLRGAEDDTGVLVYALQLVARHAMAPPATSLAAQRAQLAAWTGDAASKHSAVLAAGRTAVLYSLWRSLVDELLEGMSFPRSAMPYDPIAFYKALMDDATNAEAGKAHRNGLVSASPQRMARWALAMKLHLAVSSVEARKWYTHHLSVEREAEAEARRKHAAARHRASKQRAAAKRRRDRRRGVGPRKHV